jgi:hypothetical protein
MASSLALSLLIASRQKTFLEASELPYQATSLWFMLGYFFAAVAVLIFAAQGRAGCDSRPTLLLGFCVFICFTCLGAVRLTGYYRPAPNDIRNFIADEEKLATVRGLIATKPYVKDPCQ